MDTQVKGADAKLRKQTPNQQQQLIGAIDQGTSSTRFLVFENGSGQLIASSQIEIQRIVPKEGWVEIDPEAIISSVYSTIANVHEQLTANTGMNSPLRAATKLKCIGICNQRESTVVWDKVSGKALYNVIVWMDNRTKDIVDDMIDSVPGRDFNWLKSKTGLPMSTYFSAFKLKWLIDNVLEVKEALQQDRLLFGTVDSWILWNLTGKHLTDVTNASRTFLMDIESLSWDKSLCKHFNIPMKILPKILASADDFGIIQHGPLKGLPITGVIGDQSAALFGHNCLQLGQTKATFGTGCFIMQNIGQGPLASALSGVQRAAKRGLITTVGYKLRNQPACYALEGSIKIAGAALTWLRDNMQLISAYDECDQLVNQTTHSAGVFFVPALGGLYSPYWDPNAAGLYIGLSQFTRREHLVRATFDSIAFQTNDILSLMRGVTTGLMIDGGLCKSTNMCQILADITGCDIVRPSMCETSALGAAMVAGCGAGIWTYEEMLTNSRTPYELSPPLNQKHHYPPESLHYEEKFSSLIQSKSFTMSGLNKQLQRIAGSGNLAINDSSVRNLLDSGVGSGGGGTSDDAGGGRRLLLLDELDEVASSGRSSASGSSSRTTTSTEDEAGAITTSGQFTATTSETCNDLELPLIIGPSSVSDEISANASNNNNNNNSNNNNTLIGTTNLELPSKSRIRHHTTPSSGYSSGDNFELITTNSAVSQCTDTMHLRDSPILPSTLPQRQNSIESSTTTTTTNGNNNSQENKQVNSENRSLSSPTSEDRVSSADQSESDDQQEVSCKTIHPTIINNHQLSQSYNSQTFPSKISSCLRNCICPKKRNSIQEHNLCQVYDEDADVYDDDDDDDDNEDYNSITSFDQVVGEHLQQVDQTSNNSYMMNKPVDVFQSYISLEHRTDLVNTWRLAVARSMQWTKVHHEEVRREDYQRLSSLPISMYLFFSIGIIALGEVFSNGSGLLTR